MMQERDGTTSERTDFQRGVEAMRDAAITMVHAFERDFRQRWRDQIIASLRDVAKKADDDTDTTAAGADMT